MASLSSSRRSRRQFLAATEDPADGVTLRFTIEHPQGLKELGQALVEKGPAGSKIAETIGKASQPNIRVEVFPGISVIDQIQAIRGANRATGCALGARGFSSQA